MVVDHVVEVSNFARFVGNDRESQIAARNLVDILDPFLMRVQSIGTQSNKFDSTFLEFRLEFGKGAELERSVQKQAGKSNLGSAHGSEVLGVGEQDNPSVSNEIMELDVSLSSIRLEIRGRATQPQLLLLDSVDGAIHFKFFCRW